jgi:hypothetical protein
MTLLDTLIGNSVSEKESGKASPASPRSLESEALCRNASPPPPASPRQTSWPQESLDDERRFGQSHAKLFPFIGRKVRTPTGPGTLVQVFADSVTVVLDAELPRCSFFAPRDIEPVSWEVPE